MRLGSTWAGDIEAGRGDVDDELQIGVERERERERHGDKREQLRRIK